MSWMRSKFGIYYRQYESEWAKCESEMERIVCTIFPWLSCLGWNPGDLSVMRHERKSGSGRYDILLRDLGIPIVVLEAKLHYSDFREAIEQVCSYADSVNASMAIITDGRNFWFFARLRPGQPICRTPFVKIDMLAETLNSYAERTLAVLKRGWINWPSVSELALKSLKNNPSGMGDIEPPIPEYDLDRIEPASSRTTLTALTQKFDITDGKILINAFFAVNAATQGFLDFTESQDFSTCEEEGTKYVTKDPSRASKSCRPYVGKGIVGPLKPRYSPFADFLDPWYFANEQQPNSWFYNLFRKACREWGILVKMDPPFVDWETRTRQHKIQRNEIDKLKDEGRI